MVETKMPSYRRNERRRHAQGWMNYFGISHTYREVLELDEWMRRRVRHNFWTAQRDSALK